MGFQKRWDTDDILLQLSRMYIECSSSRNDGFTAFEIKKDLLRIKFCVDDFLAECPTFTGEDEIHHKRLIDKLK